MNQKNQQKPQPKPIQENQKILSAAEILNADDQKQETVEVPEWGGSVIIGVMSGEARDTWDFIYNDAKLKRGVEPGTGLRSYLISVCARDEKGSLLFNPQQVAALGKKSQVALDRLFQAASDINCLFEKDVKELEKNS